MDDRAGGRRRCGTPGPKLLLARAPAMPECLSTECEAPAERTQVSETNLLNLIGDKQ